VRQAVLAAPTIGYSTGPSDTALLQLFEIGASATNVRPADGDVPLAMHMILENG